MTEHIDGLRFREAHAELLKVFACWGLEEA
ncbi:hypothetical protein CCP4SC76_4490002 [Gammaproteobacteria bacterium]